MIVVSEMGNYGFACKVSSKHTLESLYSSLTPVMELKDRVVLIYMKPFKIVVPKCALKSVL